MSRWNSGDLQECSICGRRQFGGSTMEAALLQALGHGAQLGEGYRLILFLHQYYFFDAIIENCCLRDGWTNRVCH